MKNKIARFNLDFTRQYMRIIRAFIHRAIGNEMTSILLHDDNNNLNRECYQRIYIVTRRNNSADEWIPVPSVGKVSVAR